MGAFFMPLYGLNYKEAFFILKSLLQEDSRIYIYLASKELGEDFLRQAESEGFTFGDGVKPTERHYESVMALNDDMTINYVGYIGLMAYGGGAKTIGGKALKRIDYRQNPIV